MLNKILLGLVIISSALAYYFRYDADKKYSMYLNTLATSDSLKLEADGVWSKLAVAVDNIELLRKDSSLSKLEIDKLEKIVKRQEARILSMVEFSIRSNKTDTIHIADSSVITNGIEELEFREELNGIWVSGTAVSSPLSIDLTGGIIPTSFLVLLNQLKNGQYNAILTCNNPDLDITNTTAKVVKYKPVGFLDRFEFSPYVDVGWYKKTGVNVIGGLKIWRASPEIIVNEKALDYGGRFRVWSR